MRNATPEIAHTGRWTLGVLIGLPVAILALLALLFLLYISICWIRRCDPDDTFLAVGAMVLCSVAILALVGGVGFGMWPWQGGYHQYREVQGTVAQVSNRFVGDGNSTSQKFVVTLQGSPQQFGIEDTRAALLKPGDSVTLSCIRVYTYGAQYGFDCNWGKP